MGARWEWVVDATPRPLYPRERDPVPTVQEARWAPGPVWTGAENLAPTEIRSPSRPALNETLYRLSYPGPHLRVHTVQYPSRLETPTTLLQVTERCTHQHSYVTPNILACQKSTQIWLHDLIRHLKTLLV